MTRFAGLRPLRSLVAIALTGLVLAACQREEEARPPEARPVRAQVVQPTAMGDEIVLAGDVQAQKEVSFAFRIGGRVIERPVNVGDTVKAGQLLARLDPKTEQNALDAAEATLAAARGQVATARSTFDRQAQLMAQGFTTRPRYEEARQALNTAEAAVEDAEAQVETALDRLGFTELRADTSGAGPNPARSSSRARWWCRWRARTGGTPSSTCPRGSCTPRPAIP
jgi:membrane fusion protein, multidrug efflux system